MPSIRFMHEDEGLLSLERSAGGLLHTKAMLMDDQLALVGSVNLDIRSLQLNFELTLTLFSPEACASIRRLLDGYLQDSTPLELERWKQRSRAARLRL